MPFRRFKGNLDGVNAFVERMKNGVPNHEILAEVLDEKSKKFSDHVYELPKGQMNKANLPDVAKYKLQLHASFNKPDLNADYSGHSGVYLVGRPNRWARGLSRAPKPCHWSLYILGHFYHLKLAPQGSSIVLRDDPPKDWELLTDPLIAYHIGMTEYRKEHISLLAKWVTTQLDHDTLSTAAYEQFVFGLAIRILRGPSNTSAFIGNFWQIMEHDIGCSQQRQPAPSGFLTGVRLSDPDEDISTRLKRWYLTYRIETDARGLDLCWKRGRLGQISWNTHEYHPFIRSFAVGPSAISKALTKVGQRTPVLSKAVPPVYQNDMPMVAVYRRRKGTPLPRGLKLVHFYASLFYIRAEYPMNDRDFWFRIHDLLNSSSVEHTTFNRGFDDKFIFGDSAFPMDAEPFTGQMLQSSSSTMVEKELDECESTVDTERSAVEMPQPDSVIEKWEPLFDTLATHLFEHKGVKCQVMIDMTDQFESPVEI
ncbi:hypothetical protein N7471_010405 [Penicillium samsonianum]|uniref:uncharacterized protein n=1 Tax=Penicillium samsonianum TaxID=1882272 RepID=UPI00254828A9|nr:uncharacterized protein N7471_010405 [Penicillium samsonianum]KAJ6125912.1 hypothetical protein N7471_010405 [Penicillium samsonianum]